MHCLFSWHTDGSHARHVLSAGRSYRRDGGLYSTADPYTRAVTPHREPDECKIDNNKASYIGLAADTETVTVQTFAENEIDAIPRHQHREEADDARYDQA